MKAGKFLCIASFLMVISLAAAEVKAAGDITLPEPETRGKLSVEEALNMRRSRSEYGYQILNLRDLSQILWSTQAVSSVWGGRVAVDSARAKYPLEIYVVVGAVEKLKPGVYHYIPTTHRLVKGGETDVRKALANAAMGQKMLVKAPAIIVIAAFFSPSIKAYGTRGTRYVYIRAGYVGQNIYIQAEALNLATSAIGAFDDKKVKEALGIKTEPLILYPVTGR